VEYVAPEQIRGEDADGRADVYALGCLLYECLAGRPPYSGASDTAVLFAHLQSEPPTLPGLEEVLPKALAKSPEDRYQTCRELVEGARKALGLVESGRNRRRRRVAVAGAVLATVAVVAGVFLVRSGGTPALAAPGRVVRIDPKTNSVVGSASTGQDPTGIAVGAGRVWMTTVPDSSVWHVDPGTLAATRIPVNGTPVGIAVDGAVVYVAGSGGATRIVAASGQVTGLVKTAGDVTTIASGPDGAWLVASNTAYRLADVSVVPPLGAGRTDAKVPIPPTSPLDENHVGEDQAGMAVGENGVWVLGDAVDRRLSVIDPRTARIRATIRLPFAPGGGAAGLGGVWVTAQLGDKVVRIDPRTKRIVATIAVGRAPWGVAVGEGAVWVANTIDGTVSRVDPTTNRVVATIRVGAHPKEVAVGEGSVWLAAVAR
jgi:YVTN family beta-propeller protein